MMKTIGLVGLGSVGLPIAIEAGRDAKAALPMAALAHRLFLSVSGRGLGTHDDSQVIAAYRALQGGDAT